MNRERIDRAASLIGIRTAPRAVRARNGIHAGSLAGDGFELYGVRPLVDGDDPRRIDPAASARTSELHVRSLVQETQATAMLIVDASGSMSFGSRSSKWACASDTARIVARALTRAGDQLTVRRSPGPVVPARSGQRALRLVDDALHTAPAGAGSLLADLDDAIRSRSVGSVVVVSDLHQPGPAVLRALELLAHRRPVTVIRITDARELALPVSGVAVTLRDPENGVIANVTLTRELAARFSVEARRRHTEIGESVRRSGCELVEIDTADDVDTQLIEALHPRRGDKAVR